jgi:hypothetical protein
MEKAAANSAFDRDTLARYSRRIWTLVDGSWRQGAPPALGTTEQVLLARIESIYRSSSWRLTRPLRGLTRAVREKGFAAMAAAAALRQFQTSLRNLWN